MGVPRLMGANRRRTPAATAVRSRRRLRLRRAQETYRQRTSLSRPGHEGQAPGDAGPPVDVTRRGCATATMGALIVAELEPYPHVMRRVLLALANARAEPDEERRSGPS